MALSFRNKCRHAHRAQKAYLALALQLPGCCCCCAVTVLSSSRGQCTTTIKLPSKLLCYAYRSCTRRFWFCLLKMYTNGTNALVAFSLQQLASSSQTICTSELLVGTIFNRQQTLYGSTKSSFYSSRRRCLVKRWPDQSLLSEAND